MALEVLRKKKADPSLGTCRGLLESGRASLESARLRVMNSINLDGGACLFPKVENIQSFHSFDHEA